MKHKIKFLLAVFFVTTLSQAIAAPNHDHRVLRLIGKRVEHVNENGKTPVVLFDIDDTLMNSKVRIAKILKNLGRNEEFIEKHTIDSYWLRNMRIEDARYHIEDTLNAIGITNPETAQEIIAYWRPLFFSDLCVLDRPITGAAHYLRWLKSKGAQIVYLTGRDEPGMGKGTRDSLKLHHFPEGTLMMRPDPQTDELEFKKQALQKVRQMGIVVGVFENEPRNLNMMIEAFPKATAVFLDTIHSKKPDVPNEKAHWILNYKLNSKP